MVSGYSQVSDIKTAAEQLEDAVDQKIEEAKEAAAEGQQATPAPNPEPKDDVGVHERLTRIEERLTQPFEDPRVPEVLQTLGNLTNRLTEALSDAVAEVEEVTPDPDPGANPVEPVVEAAEAAPKRVNRFLKRLW